MLSDHNAKDLRHWAEFGLVYPKTASFDPGSPTPGHEAKPPRYRQGADTVRILRVEEVISQARKLAQSEVEAVAASAREDARERALCHRLRLTPGTGESEAREATRQLRSAVAGMRAILALAYGPERGHFDLERTLALPESEQLRDDAERYYERAAGMVPERLRREHPSPPPIEHQVQQVTRSLASLMPELKRLVARLGLRKGEAR
jgi:hypothetical protein